MTEDIKKSIGIIESLKERYKYVRLIELRNVMILELNLVEFKRFLLCSNVLEEDSTFLEEPKHPDFKVNLGCLDMILLEIFKTSSGESIPIFEFIKKEEKNEIQIKKLVSNRKCSKIIEKVV